MNELTHISLFSGIGGFDLAAECSGFKSKAIVEINEFCRNILKLRFPNAKQFEDVTKVSGDDLIEACNGERPTVMSGGFPCQPVSVAGQHKGEKDERWMWPDYIRLIRECNPHWIIIENSTRLYTIQEFRQIKNDLGDSGYEFCCFSLQATSVGAPHVRERAVIVAHSNSESGLQTNPRADSIREKCITWNTNMWDFIGQQCGYETIANSKIIRRETNDNKQSGVLSEVSRSSCDSKLSSRGNRDSWEIESRGSCFQLPDWSKNPSAICRMDDGISPRLDKPRLQAIGNAVVPRVFYPIFRTIKFIETGE